MDAVSKTREVKTPTGRTIVAQNYLTGADRRRNRRLIWQLSEEGKGRTAEALEAAENALVVELIISIDGKKEGDPVQGSDQPFSLVAELEAMQADDYDFMIDLINEIAAGLDKKKEATSGGSTAASSTEQK